MWFDPRTNLVVESQAFDDSGVLIASAELSRYKDAKLPTGELVMVPGKIEITNPGDNGFVRIETSEPQRKDIRPIVFDPNRLSRSYRIHQTIDLDEPAQITVPTTESESSDPPTTMDGDS